VPVKALRAVGLQSMEEFVRFEAAGKAAGRWVPGSWPPGIRVDSVAAPAGYLAAVAAPGDDWALRLRGATPWTHLLFHPDSADRIDGFC
jgi:hypothetical protein